MLRAVLQLLRRNCRDLPDYRLALASSMSMATTTPRKCRGLAAGTPPPVSPPAKKIRKDADADFKKDEELKSLVSFLEAIPDGWTDPYVEVYIRAAAEFQETVRGSETQTFRSLLTWHLDLAELNFDDFSKRLAELGGCAKDFLRDAEDPDLKAYTLFVEAFPKDTGDELVELYERALAEYQDMQLFTATDDLPSFRKLVVHYLSLDDISFHAMTARFVELRCRSTASAGL